MNAKQIAKMLGRSEKQIKQVAKICGVHPIPGDRRRGPDAYSEESIDAIVRYFGIEPASLHGKG